MDNLLTNLIAAAVFALLGIALFGLAFYLIEKMTPGVLWKEIMEDQNTALGVLVGLMAVGISIIIAAAIH
jgi:putative membrane protein